jgi:DNA-binding MarR family transcriptional regulator
MSEKDKNSSKQYRAEDSVGYLLSRSRMKLAKSLDTALAEFDITNAQGGTVLMLASGKFETAADLARELYIDSASMTRMIDRLEKRGLIRRERREDDRRVVSLALTPDGQELAERLPQVYAGVVGANFSGFSTDELESLKNLLRKFLAIDMASKPAESNDEPS